MSRGISVHAEAAKITAAAANCVTGTPTRAASGPAISAPSGIAASEPNASYDDTLASLSGGILVAICTVHCTIITSTSAPRANATRQMTGSGATSPSTSGEIAHMPPVHTTNSIGLRGV